MRTRQLKDGQIRRALAGLAGSKPKGQVLDVPPFHPFPARMPLGIAEYLIDRLSGTRDVVLDPMVGSGTTVVAAKRLGRMAIGIDRDPLALLLTRTATRCFESQALALLKERVLKAAQKRTRLQSRLHILRRSLPAEERQFLKYWFPH